LGEERERRMPGAWRYVFSLYATIEGPRKGEIQEGKGWKPMHLPLERDSAVV